ncbi:hypothetical protein ACFV4N_11860 [Actinosynnema sp. NPDC059797]
MTSRRLLGVTLFALTTAGLLGGVAAATPGKGPDKNLDANHPNACAVAGLSGRAVDGDEGDLELPHTVTGRTTLTVEGGVAGHTVTGVVVKGGDGYLVYPAAELGELPWEGLVPPLNNGGQLPDISHWFFCVEPGGQPEQPGGEPGPEPEQPGGEPEQPGGEPEQPGGEPGQPEQPERPSAGTPNGSSTAPTTPGSATPATTTSAPAAVATDDLADTGFGSAWLLFAGLGLVALGAVFVASPKLRGLIRR